MSYHCEGHGYTHECAVCLGEEHRADLARVTAERDEARMQRDHALIDFNREVVLVVDTRRRAAAAERDRDAGWDCKQDGVCSSAPGCSRHWAERNRELLARAEAAENELERRKWDWEIVCELVGQRPDTGAELAHLLRVKMQEGRAEVEQRCELAAEKWLVESTRCRRAEEVAVEVKDRLAEVEAQAAAMRGGLSGLNGKIPLSYWPTIDAALSTDAGRTLLDELRALRRVRDAAAVASVHNTTCTGGCRLCSLRDALSAAKAVGK